MVQELTSSMSNKLNQPTIIKAFALWCPHCTKMKPIFEELERKHGKKYLFVEFDTDASPDLTEQFQVSSLPTFIFIKNNKEVGRIEGELSQDELDQAITKYLG